MQTIYTNAEWYAKFTVRMCLFWLPGVGIASVIPDTMHCKHLGTDAYFAASAILLVCEFINSSDMTGSMRTLWQCIKKHQLGNVPSFYEITLSMVVPGEENFPVLKGKASYIKHLMRPLYCACLEFLDGDRQVHRWVLHGLRCSAEIEDILESNKNNFKLREDSAHKLLTTVTEFLAFQTSLRDHFGTAKQLFHITIKSHYLLHIAIIVFI